MTVFYDILSEFIKTKNTIDKIQQNKIINFLNKNGILPSSDECSVVIVKFKNDRFFIGEYTYNHGVIDEILKEFSDDIDKFFVYFIIFGFYEILDIITYEPIVVDYYMLDTKLQIVYVKENICAHNLDRFNLIINNYDFSIYGTKINKNDNIFILYSNFYNYKYPKGPELEEVYKDLIFVKNIKYSANSIVLEAITEPYTYINIMSKIVREKSFREQAIVFLKYFIEKYNSIKLEKQKRENDNNLCLTTHLSDQLISFIYTTMLYLNYLYDCKIELIDSFYINCNMKKNKIDKLVKYFYRQVNRNYVEEIEINNKNNNIKNFLILDVYRIKGSIKDLSFSFIIVDKYYSHTKKNKSKSIKNRNFSYDNYLEYKESRYNFTIKLSSYFSEQENTTLFIKIFVKR